MRFSRKSITWSALPTDEGSLAGKSSPDAREQDAHYGYRYYLSPTGVAQEDLEEPSLIELARVIKAGLCIGSVLKVEMTA
jgi:hypothetical protein